MHKITATPSQGLIESKLSGFMSVADVVAYSREVEPLIRECAAAGPYRMLIDVSDCAIQPQEVVCAFQKHVASVPQSKRLAVVTGSSIVRMQVRRILDTSRMAMFSTRSEALAWLHLSPAEAANG